MTTSATAAILLLLTAVLPAQEEVATPDSPALEELVWSYLECSRAGEAGGILSAIRRHPELSLARLEEILDRPPPLRRAPEGLQDELPFTIPGTRVKTTYSLYVPPGYDPEHRYPLWIVVHGTGGRGRATLRSVLHLLRDREVLVAAPTEAADLHGRGWGSSHRERMLHIGLVDDLARRYPIDRDRVVVFGWSRGGHAAWDLAMRFPDRFVAIGPIIGSVAMRDRALLVNLGGVRVDAINGAKDQPELVAGAVEGIRRLLALGYDATHHLDPDRGHEGFGEQLPGLVERLAGVRRAPAPATLRLAAYEKEYARNRYVRILAFHKDAYRPGRKIAIAGVSKMSPEEQRRGYLDHIEEHTPSIETSFEDNVFRIRSRLITRFELFLPLALVDLGKPLEVWVNGKRQVRKSRIAAPRPAEVLKLMRDFGGADPGFRFAGKLSLRGR